MSKRPCITEAMREVAGSTRAKPTLAINQSTLNEGKSAKPIVPKTNQPSRAGTKAITGHYPPIVRYQLKLLAAEQNRTMEDALAEAINLLFATYNKPEIAPAVKEKFHPGT